MRQHSGAPEPKWNRQITRRIFPPDSEKSSGNETTLICIQCRAEMNNVYSCGYEEVHLHTQTYNVICDKTGVVLGDTKYQVSLLPIPGSRMVVSSTEIGFAFAAVFASSDKVHPPVQCYDSSNGHRTNQHNQWSTTSEGKTISLGTKILQHVTVQINA